MPQASSATGRPARDVTQSSTTSAPALAGSGGDLGDRLARAGGGLGVDEGRPPVGARGGWPPPSAWSSSTLPGSASTRVTRAPMRVATSHIRSPKTPGHADHDVVARLEEIGEAGLHAAAAGAGERNGERVRGAEEAPQPLLRLVDEGEKGGVEVAEQRLRHGGEHARMRVRRSRAEQQATRQGGRRHGCHANA